MNEYRKTDHTEMLIMQDSPIGELRIIIDTPNPGSIERARELDDKILEFFKSKDKEWHEQFRLDVLMGKFIEIGEGLNVYVNNGLEDDPDSAFMWIMYLTYLQRIGHITEETMMHLIRMNCCNRHIEYNSNGNPVLYDIHKYFRGVPA